MAVKDFAEVRFAWLLRQRGIRSYDERNLPKHFGARRTKPDFYAVSPGCLPFLAEVESFREPGPLRKATARVYATSPDQMLRRLRTAVQHALNQLKPYRDLGIPMIAVLDGWRRSGVALDRTELKNLLGTQEIRFHVSLLTGQRVGPLSVRGSEESFHVLRAQNAGHLSGVAVNLPKQGHQYTTPWNKERIMRLRVLHNPYAQVPLPLDLFSDAEDEHIGWVGGEWLDMRSGCPLLT
jgi:hypothetical protein